MMAGFEQKIFIMIEVQRWAIGDFVPFETILNKEIPKSTQI